MSKKRFIIYGGIAGAAIGVVIFIIAYSCAQNCWSVGCMACGLLLLPSIPWLFLFSPLLKIIGYRGDVDWMKIEIIQYKNNYIDWIVFGFNALSWIIIGVIASLILYLIVRTIKEAIKK